MRPLILLLGACLLALPAHGRIIYTKLSLYRNITVTDDGMRRCLKFSAHRKVLLNQSCIFDHDHDRMVFDYSRLVLSALLLDPHPQRVLIVGLGGGILPRTLGDLYPQATIDTVEIDPAVVDVAKRFFGFSAGGHERVIVSDGRVFARRAALKHEHYDLVVLDAFNGDYIPPHLMTLEFLRGCRKLLTPDGVLVANTFSSSKLYDSESVTYEKAFGWFLNLRRESGNRIVLTRRGERVSPAQLRQRAENFSRDLSRYDVDMRDIAGTARDKPDWNPDARVLTDQYAPVNLLNGGGG